MNFFIKYKWHFYFFIVGIFLLTAVIFTISSYDYSSSALQKNLNLNPVFEATKSFLLGISGAGVVSTMLLSVLNSIEDRYVKIIENTYTHITKWDDAHLAAARKFTRGLKEQKFKMSDEEFLKHIDDNEDLKHSISLVCNFFENVRISYKTNRIDMKLFNSSLGYVMEDYHHRLRPYVKKNGEAYLKDWDEILELSKIGKEK